MLPSSSPSRAIDASRAAPVSRRIDAGRAGAPSAAGRLVGRSLARRLLLALPLAVYAAYFLLKPFYLFPSGSPQIADFLALGLIVALIAVGTGAPGPDARRMSLFAGLFIVYAAVVNVVWAALLGNAELFKAPVFLLFNFALFFLTLLLSGRYGDRFHRWTIAAVIASVLLVALLSLVSQSPTRRQAVSFENPNQLGYWSLLSVSIFLLCSLRVHVHWALKVAICCASFYLVALSLSKAAILSAAALFALAFVTKPRQLLAAIPIAAAIAVGMAGSELVENLMWRLSNIGEQADDSLARRGYALLGRFPYYLLFGAGQGAYERFYEWNPREFHSTLGTVFFCYGAIGLSLFGLFLLQILRTAGLYRFAFLGPAFLYGVTHQGLRFSLFWTLLAIVATARPAGGRSGIRP